MLFSPGVPRRSTIVDRDDMRTANVSQNTDLTIETVELVLIESVQELRGAYRPERFLPGAPNLSVLT